MIPDPAATASSVSPSTRPLLLLAAAFVGLNILKTGCFGVTMVGFAPSIFAYKLVFSAGLLIPLLWLLTRLGRGWLVGFYVFQWLFMTANLISYWTLDVHLKLGHYLALAGEGLTTLRHQAVPLDASLLLLLVDLPLLVALWPRWARLREALSRHPVISRLSWASGLIVIAAVALFSARGESLGVLLKDSHAGEVRIIKRYGVAFSNLLDVVTLRQDRRYERELEYGPRVSGPGHGEGPASFLVLQVEGLGANVIGYEHAGEPLTPFLNGLARRSIYYPYNLSYHRAGGTSDCEFTILNGVEPLGSYPVMKLRNYEFPNSLAHILRERGYEVFAFHNNYGSFFNRDVAFSQMGFTKFYDLLAMGLRDANWGAEDRDVFRFVIEKLRGQRKPYYYHVITMSSHEPFHFVRDYFNDPRFDDVEPEVVSDYFNSLAYVDQAVRELVEEALSIDPGLYIVITGDHSPFVIREGYNVASKRIDSIGRQKLEFVPLIIHTPDGRVYEERERAASFLDIGVSIMSASGVPFDMLSQGSDLFELPFEAETVRVHGTPYSRRLIFEAAASTR